MMWAKDLEADSDDGVDVVDVALARQKHLAASHAANPLARLIFAGLAARIARTGADGMGPPRRV